MNAKKMKKVSEENKLKRWLKIIQSTADYGNSRVQVLHDWTNISDRAIEELRQLGYTVEYKEYVCGPIPFTKTRCNLIHIRW